MRSGADRLTNARSRRLAWAPLVVLALAAAEARGQCASWRAAEVGARYEHVMVYDSRRDRLVLVGGVQDLPRVSNTMGDTWEWDGLRWELRSTAGPAARSGACAAYDADRGVTVLFGGSVGGSALNGETWEWDGERWAQRQVAGPAARSSSAMSYDPVRRVSTLIAGYGSSASGSAFSDIWEWNGALWALRAPTSGNTYPGSDHTLTHDTVRNCTMLWAESWGPAYWSGTAWSAIPNLPINMQDGKHMLAFDTARGVAVLHGRNASAPSQPWETWEWNGTVWARRATPGPVCGGASAMAYDSARGKSALVGRQGPFGGSQPGLHMEWDGAAWTDRSAPLPEALTEVYMAYDSARGVTVRFGGLNTTTQPSQETWEFNGETWRLAATTGPGRLRDFALAFDRNRGVTVLYGGRVASSGVSITSTWEWNGVAWTERAIPGPGARNAPCLAFDEARGVIVLYSGNSLRSDTWEYDGAAWTRKSEGGGPLPAEGSPLVYDPARQRCVLFGGGFLGYAAWEWDGANWALMNIDGPPPEHRVRVVFDRDRGVFVTYGGYTVAQQWEFDHAQWRQVAVPAVSSPGRRDRFGMVYDEMRGAALLHGGLRASDVSGLNGDVSRQSWYYGGDLRIIAQPHPLILDAGDRAEFAVRMAGGAAHEFRWKRDGAPLIDGGRVHGAGTRTLVIDPVTLADRGEYTVDITLACGAATSEGAALAVACPGDANGDGLVNFLDLNIVLGGFGVVAPGLPGDLDGDGDCDFADLNLVLGAYGVSC